MSREIRRGSELKQPVEAHETLSAAGNQVVPCRPNNLLLLAIPAAVETQMLDQAERAGYSSWRSSAPQDDWPPPTVGPVTIAVNIDDEVCLQAIPTLRDRFRSARIVAVAWTSSVSRLADAVRRGVSAIAIHPSSLSDVVDQNRRPGTVPCASMSLDRAIWEFLIQTLREAGSIAGAARRLRLDRTSLKRMLRKVPPLP